MRYDILIGGDFCPSAECVERLHRHGANWVFNDVVQLIQSSRLFVANLEGPATNKVQRAPKDGGHLKTDPNVMALLRDIGFDGFGLANNHSMDYGSSGLEDTLRAIEEHGMFHFGTRSSIHEKRSAQFVNVDGKVVGLYAVAEKEFNSPGRVAMGVNILDPVQDAGVLKNAKKDADHVVILYHGGLEYYPLPTPRQQQTCKFLVDCGADVVVCQHSHIVGASEWYNGGYILYGQGNMLLPRVQRRTDSWNLGLMVGINFKGGKMDIELIPTVQELNGARIKRLSAEKAKQCLTQQAEFSAEIKNENIVRAKFDAEASSRAGLYKSRLAAESRIVRLLRGKVGRSKLSVLKDYATQRNLIECSTHREILELIWQLEDEKRD